MKHSRSLGSRFSSRFSSMLIIAVVFGVIGAAALLRSFAATDTVGIPIEAESATLAGSARLASASDASGGSSVALHADAPASATVIRSINYHPGSEHVESSVAKMAEAKMQSVRLNFHWDHFQPNAKHQWNSFFSDWTDKFMAAAKANNIKVLAIVMMSPGWANGGQPANSRNFKDADFCDYIKDINERWGDTIEAYEIWNEPGLDHFMEGSQEQKAERYAPLLKSSYACVKAMDSTKLVLGGSLYQPVWNNQEFLDMIYARGVKGHFDVLSQHMYGDHAGHASGYGNGLSAPLTFKQLFDTVQSKTIATMAKYGDTTTPIWITETGVNTSTSSKGNSEALQAERLSEAYDLIKQRYNPRIQRLYWYQWADNGAANSADYEQRLGIISREGDTWREKPAFGILKSK